MINHSKWAKNESPDYLILFFFQNNKLKPRFDFNLKKKKNMN